MDNRQHTIRRWGGMLAGTLLLAAGVAAILLSDFGSGPIDALVYTLSEHSGWSIAIMSLLVSAVFIAAAWIGGIRPSYGTVISMTAFAPLLALMLDLAPHDVGAAPTTLVIIGEWLLGAILIAAGSALMIVANLGVGAYDAATLAISRRTRLSIPKSRIVLDLGVAAGAFALGGPIWIGTLGLLAIMPILLAVLLPVTRRVIDGTADTHQS